MRRASLVVSLLILACVSARADEPDKELAKTRFKAGQVLFQRGRAADALVEFEDGKKSFPLPEFDYNIGLCLAKLDRPAEAADALQRYMEARPDDPDAAGIWRMIAELRAEAARRKQAEPPPPAPSPAPSVEPQVLAPPPAAPDAPRAKRRALFTSVAIAAATVGGAMVVAGAFVGGSALGERNDYDRGCDRGHCNQPMFDRAHTMALTADVLIPVGAALVVTSIVLFATRPKLPPRLAWGVAF